MLRGTPAVEPHKAAILAALQITDELFQAKEADSALAQSLRELGDELRHRLPPAKRQAVE